MSLGSEEMMEEFRIEMAEIAQGLDEALLRWERDPGNPDLPEKIFRQLHTLKGSSGFMELFDLSELCHAAEDVISAFRKGAGLSLPMVQSAVTRAVQEARQILDVRVESAQHPHLKPLAQELRILAKSGTTGREPTKTQDLSLAQDQSRAQELIRVDAMLSAAALKLPLGHPSSSSGNPASDETAGVPERATPLQRPAGPEGLFPEQQPNIVTSRPTVEPPVMSHRPPPRPIAAAPSIQPNPPPSRLPVRSSLVLNPAPGGAAGMERAAPVVPPSEASHPASPAESGDGRDMSRRTIHHAPASPRYTTPAVRRSSHEGRATPRKFLRITQTGQAPSPQASLMGSSLLGDHRDRPSPLEPGALGPWSPERLEALREGQSPASLRAAGQKQEPTASELASTRRADVLRRTPSQTVPDGTLNTLQQELEAALKRDPILNLLPRGETAGSRPLVTSPASPGVTSPLSGAGATEPYVLHASLGGPGLEYLSQRLPRGELELGAGAVSTPLRRGDESDPIELLLSGDALPSELGSLLDTDGAARLPTERGVDRTSLELGTDKRPAPPLSSSSPGAELGDRSDLEVGIAPPEASREWAAAQLAHSASGRDSWRLPRPELPSAERSTPQPGLKHDESLAGVRRGISDQAFPNLEPTLLPVEHSVSPLEDSGLFIDRATTVRVDVSKLDTLLNLMGDLLQEKYRQNRLVEELIEKDPDNPTVAAMASTHRRFERQLSQLQDAVLSTRMLPVQGVFRRYPRIVKDLAARLGKEVELVIEGEQTELDRALLEGLFEPLIHLLRNSIDHGVGTPMERIRANKSRKGTITLSASQEGNQIVLEIRDDGRGIDPDEMVNRAIKLKLLDPDRAKELNEQEKIDLIFLAGFTSRPEVTETSGRGVGMSVVRDHLRRIGGLITVQSKKGVGTTLRIAMPLTLAILQVLLVRVGKGQYAIPLSSVVGAWRVEREQLTLYRGGWYLPRPGSMLPLFSLSALLGLEPPSLPPERCYVAEVGVAEKRYGIWVTGFDGIYESVIKSLEGSLTRLPGVAGGTFIGTGEMVLVLDMGALLEGQLTNRRE